MKASPIRNGSPPRRWASHAIVYTHAMAAWWGELHPPRRRTVRLKRHGNVVYLPRPVAGYQIRYDGQGAIVEIKPSHAPAIFLGRCADAAAARALLAHISAEHCRPFLGELGGVAA